MHDSRSVYILNFPSSVSLGVCNWDVFLLVMCCFFLKIAKLSGSESQPREHKRKTRELKRFFHVSVNFPLIHSVAFSRYDSLRAFSHTSNIGKFDLSSCVNFPRFSSIVTSNRVDELTREKQPQIYVLVYIRSCLWCKRLDLTLNKLTENNRSRVREE